MWALVIMAGMLMVFVANSFYTEYIQHEVPWNANDAAKDFGRYQAFAAAATLYMRDNASLMADTEVGAATIMSNAKGLPSAYASLSTTIDSSWKIHVLGGGDFLLCTGMSSGGVAKMSSLPQVLLWNPSIKWQQGNTTASGGNPLVTFDVSSTLAQKCS